MTGDVFAYPRTAGAVHWLYVHAEEMRSRFRSLHKGGKGLEPVHPHGLQVLLPPMTTESSFVPGKEPEALYVYIPAHGDKTHLRRTVEDFKRLLSELHATVADFDIEVA